MRVHDYLPDAAFAGWTAPRAWIFLPCDYRLPAMLYYPQEIRGFSLTRGVKLADGTLIEVPGLLLAVGK